MSEKQEDTLILCMIGSLIIIAPAIVGSLLIMLGITSTFFKN